MLRDKSTSIYTVQYWSKPDDVIPHKGTIKQIYEHSQDCSGFGKKLQKKISTDHICCLHICPCLRIYVFLVGVGSPVPPCCRSQPAFEPLPSPGLLCIPQCQTVGLLQATGSWLQIAWTKIRHILGLGMLHTGMHLKQHQPELAADKTMQHTNPMSTHLHRVVLTMVSAKKASC